MWRIGRRKSGADVARRVAGSFPSQAILTSWGESVLVAAGQEFGDSQRVGFGGVLTAGRLVAPGNVSREPCRGDKNWDHEGRR